MSDQIFQGIIDKTIPADIVYEDEHCLAFHDIQPQAPIHILVIPKLPIQQLNQATTEHQSLMGHLMLTANAIAAEQGIGDAYRVVINNGAKAGQSVFHLHLHILGGRIMQWPPG